MSDGLSKYHRIKDRLAALSAQFRAYKNELRKCKSFIQNSNLIGKTDDNHGDLIKIHNDAECSRADRKHSGELAGTLIKVRMGKILPIEGADRIEATLKAWENAPPESKRKAKVKPKRKNTSTILYEIAALNEDAKAWSDGKWEAETEIKRTTINSCKAFKEFAGSRDIEAARRRLERQQRMDQRKT